MSKSKPAGNARNTATNEDLRRELNSIAPFELASEWDNVGLIAGGDGWRVRRVLFAIDLTDAVAREALRKRADALVVYHPPIFKGVRRITHAAEAPTTMLAELLAARISIFAVHTAWDAAVGGTNDALLDLFDVVDRRPLQPILRKNEQYKLVVFVPAQHLEALRAALAQAGAGTIGAYDECSFSSPGRGSFRGDQTTHPAVGNPGRLEIVDEQRLEMVVPAIFLNFVLGALYQHHPYEEPAFDLIPLHVPEQRGAVGLGRTARLKKAQSGVALVDRLRRRVDLSVATVIGNMQQEFQGVTAAAGSFDAGALDIPNSFIITGELKHHDQLRLLRRGTAGVGVICLGHDRSERPGLLRLRARLAKALPRLRLEISEADVSPAQGLGELVVSRVRRRARRG